MILKNKELKDKEYAMKKVLAWVLLFVMLFGMLAGCKKDKSDTPTTAPSEVVTAADAMEYVKAIYPNTEEPLKTAIDYQRMGVVRISDIPFTVVWSTDLSEDLIKIVPSEDGTMVTIDINEQCQEDTPYVLTATITDEMGGVATHSWNCLLPKAIDMVSVVKEAYALKPGESLPYECTLIGKIVSIDTVWSADYQNITVTIAVEGAEDMPIKCYRLKGDGAKDLQVGNIITVTGTIKNYNGTIEFDAGCILEAVEKGDAVDAPTDVGEILKAAYKLKDGKSLPYPVTLTGVVTEIESPYDPGYKNISVVILMEGYSKYPVLCYRLKGTGVENIAVNDTITVTGIIKNYKGTIEFDSGCQMTDRVSGGGVAQKPSSDAAKILRDAKKLKPGEHLNYVATLSGEIVSLDDPYDSEYKNITVTINVNGTKIQCYRLKSGAADASKITVTDKITVTGIIENYNGKLEFRSGCTLDEWTKGSRKVTVNYGPLAENTAYKMEMKLPPLGKNVYFNGKISEKNYLQTGTYEKGVEVFMEKHSGKGVRFYFLDGETKTYLEIKMVKVTGSDGKTSDKARPQLTNTPSAYWNYDTETGVYTVSINWVKYYLGTYTNNGETFETASASSVSYLTASAKGKTQFYFDFVTEASDAPEKPAEPEAPVVSGLPATKDALKTGDKVVIYAPFYSKALSTEKVSTYYNKGVDLTVKNGALAGYGNSEIWTVTVNSDGTYSFANGGKNIGMADSFSSMNLGEKHDDWQLISLGDGLFNIKNVGRNSFMEWYAEMNNWSSYSTSSAATNKLCQMSIYVIGKGVYTKDADVPVTPDTPAVELPKEDGATVSIADAIAAGSAMEHNTYTELKYKVTGVITEVYQTTHGNMKIEDAEGNILTIYGTYDATGDIRYDKLEVKPVAGDTVTIYGPIGQYDGTPQIKNGWIVEHTPAGTTPDVPDVPDVPDTPDTSAALETGDQVIIYAPAYNKALSSQPASEGSYYQLGVDITVADGTVTGYGDTEIWTVTKNEDGSYSFANGGQNIAMAAEFSSMKLGEVNDDWQLESLGGSLYNVKNVVRGNYMEWYSSKNNWSTYGSQSAATDDQFQLSFYVIGEGILGEGTENPDTPDIPDVPDTPDTSTALETGDQVIIYAPAYNKALSSQPASEGSYYQLGVDITVADGTVTGYGDTEIWTVTKNEDGSYSFANGGQNIAMAAEFSSMKLGEVNDDWQLESLGGSLYNVKNVVRGNYMEWYSSKNNWSTYGSQSAATDDQFQLSFYVIGEGILGEGTENPDTPDTPTPDEVNYGPLVENKAYVVQLIQAKLSKTLYLDGGVNEKGFLTGTEDVSAAITVYVEKVEGEGIRFFTTNNPAKTYIEIYKTSEDKIRPNYTTTAGAVWTYNEEAGTYTVEIEGTEYYLGTYNTFDTFSPSSISYITGSNAADVGVSQFLATCVDPSTLPEEDPKPDTPDPEPVAGAYTMISKLADLKAGTYKMAAYLTADSDKNDISANPYHLWDGTVNYGDLVTNSYAFADGELTAAATDTKADVVLVAVEGKANTYYVKVGDQYLYSSQNATNRKLALGDTPTEWVATDNANGGITFSSNGVSMGSASAKSKFIRSYAKESTLKYGLVFFLENAE